MGHYLSEMGPTPSMERREKRRKDFEKALKKALETAPNKFVEAKLREAQLYTDYRFDS